MNRPARKSRRTRSAMFEALQPRELMAADASLFYISDRLDWPTLTGEQWAQQILTANENSSWNQRDKPLNDLKKFDSEEQAKTFLTDELLKTWSTVLGKPVNNQLNHWYGYDYYSFNRWPGGVVSRADMLDSSGGMRDFAIVGGSPLANSTNNQISSVDEADKFEVSANGFVYTLGNNFDSTFAQVTIFDARDPKNLLKVAKIEVDGWSSKMHLVGDQLILVSRDWRSTIPGGASKVQVYDVSDASKPTLQTSLWVSGGEHQSRFAAGQLNLYSSSYINALRPLFISDNPNTVYARLTETPIGRFETAEEYAARIQPLVVGWMLPDVFVEGTDVNLNNDWNDLVASANSNFRNQVSVLSFKLNDTGLELIDSESIIGVSMGGMLQASFVDDNTIYVTEQLSSFPSADTVFVPNERTEIFAIEFNAEEVKYVASGVVPGTIRDSRMMDEFEGNLRVFSEVREWFGETASTDLYILKPDAGKLDVIGQLTDVADGQALYSAYFDEDQAYITTWITFRIDPLHGFDLSDPTNPQEISELEIPGVSTYLQRVDESHLVGVGFVDSGTGGWLQQVSLYDVSDMKNFKVVDTWTSDSVPVVNLRGWNQNPLAINFDSRTGLFSIASYAFNSSSSQGLTVLKIDTGDAASITEVGKLGDENLIALRSTIVGDAFVMISNAWLHSYAVDDLSVELDRELLAPPGVADSLSVEQGKEVAINVLANDRLTGGRVTSVSASAIGGVATILEDGARIQYKAPDKEGVYGESETLTYTVTLPSGETYTGQLFINTYRGWVTFPYVDYQPVLINWPTLTEIVPEETIVRTITEKSVEVPFDINNDGEASPMDALLVVEFLNQQSARIVAGEPLIALSEINSMMDTSKDGEITPVDLLLIVNLLNAKAELLASGEASEAQPEPVVANELQANDEAMMAVLASGASDVAEELRRSKKFIAA